MNRERDKFLTEEMGECWHEWDNRSKYNPPRFAAVICKNCGQSMKNAKMNTNLSSWEGFGKLWEWAQKQEWWIGFCEFANNNFLDFAPQGKRLFPSLVHPDRFANALYEFLRGCNENN